MMMQYIHLAFAPGENVIVSGAADNVVRTWRGNTERKRGLHAAHLSDNSTDIKDLSYTVDTGIWNGDEVIVSGWRPTRE